MDFPTYDDSENQNEEICRLEFARFSESGALIHNSSITATAANNDNEYIHHRDQIRHGRGNGFWRLVRGNRVVCIAKKPEPWCSEVFFNHLDDDGRMIRKIRLENGFHRLSDYHFYELNNIDVSFGYVRQNRRMLKLNPFFSHLCTRWDV